MALSDSTVEGLAAIVTGGASGIERAEAKLFPDEGATVLAPDIPIIKHEAKAQAIGLSARFIASDVCGKNGRTPLIVHIEATGGSTLHHQRCGRDGALPRVLHSRDFTETEFAPDNGVTIVPHLPPA